MRRTDPHGATTIVAESRRGGLIYLWLTAAVIALDQLTKTAIEHSLGLYQSVVVLPVLEITRLHNTGAAFSFLADAAGWQRWVFTALAIIVSVALILWLRRIDRAATALASAVSLILAGALGNVIDRLRLGHVIDFIQVHWGEHYFPAFNVADSAITIGAALLLLDAWLEAR
ncbi:MAG TPA: signal peptidase II [Steroidobacteraceae bacterium]|jgi:signal peptidase II|nr:signal peptidase II [Steroidobacteraceae bacterium]